MNRLTAWSAPGRFALGISPRNAALFGWLFHTLLDEMAHWAEDRLACQPVPRSPGQLDRRGIPTIEGRR